MPTMVFSQEIASILPPEDMIADQDKAILDQQASEIFKQWDTLSQPLKNSSVYIVSGRRCIAMGTVVAPGIVMSKLSDIAVASKHVYPAVVDINGNVYRMNPLIKIDEHDLLIMEVPGLKSNPITIAGKPTQLTEGDMIAAVLPDGKVSNFGIVSVAQRSLREEDSPYLGLVIDPEWTGNGVKIEAVEFGQGTYKAGLRKGDVITKLNNVELSGMFSLRTALNRVKPGDTVKVEYSRNNQQHKASIKTTARPNFGKFPQQRLEVMNSMGNRMNIRRDDFPSVVQTDMTLKPEYAGSPVINLNGEVVGIALSRAGRTETYLLPAWVWKDIIDTMLPRLKEEGFALKDKPIEETQKSKGGQVLRSILDKLRRAIHGQGDQPKNY